MNASTVRSYCEKMSVKEEGLRNVVKNISKFSSEYFRILSEDEPNRNIICSPLSTAVVLSMATYGARGRTEDQLRTALHMSNDTATKDGFQSLIDVLNSFKAVELRLANKIFAADGLNLRSEFNDILTTVFRSKSEIFDPKQPEESSRTVNLWCERETNNRIKNVVEPGDMANAVLILLNAVYFKGDWAVKFNPDLTSARPFHIDENTTKEVPMMFRSAKFNFGQVKGFRAQFLELPYKSNDAQDSMSMFVILPDEPKEMKHIEANLDKIDFAELRGPAHKVDVHLPKFKIECKFDLNEILQKMGVKDIFANTADFSGISHPSRLKVSKVVQKAFIEVNEEGSEAAAVTGMHMVLMCMPMSFIVDRPFICVITANHFGVQLFSARVVDPTST